MIKVQREDINLQEAIDSVRNPSSGGTTMFLGTVRDNAKGRKIAKMSIEVYESMAVKQLTAIRDEAVEKFDLHEATVIHRYGELNVMDNIVFIAAAAGHRDEAFTACRYIIDELKQRVPIWKKETTPEGDFWVEGEKHE